MSKIPTESTRQDWSQALASPATEFDTTPLSVIAGKLPPGLRGTLYRNGPGRLERGTQHVGHWFDGDGAILAVHFTPEGAQGIYRYVQTEGYLAEQKAGQLLYGNYGMRTPGAIWNHWLGWLTDRYNLFKNTANTSVLALPDQLLALWEAGNPYALDLQTLETQGVENLEQLAPHQPYCAHPLRDPQTGTIFSIGVDSTSTLHLYKSNHTGKIRQHKTIKLDELPFLHSFVLAGKYLVFFLPPLRFNTFSFLLGTSSYCDAIKWQPSQGTQILVVDGETLEIISRGETESWFQWHFGNGCVEADGTVRLDLVRFANFSSTNEYLREMATGQTHTPALGTLWQVRLNPQTGKVIEMQQMVDRCCEFPTVQPQKVGQPWRYTYLALHRQSAVVGKEWFGAIARFDYQTGTLTEADCGDNRYTVEPIYAADALNPEQGWLLSLVYDGNLDSSEVWVFDERSLDTEPVCRLQLPQVTPLSFHGTWKPAG